MEHGRIFARHFAVFWAWISWNMHRKIRCMTAVKRHTIQNGTDYRAENAAPGMKSTTTS